MGFCSQPATGDPPAAEQNEPVGWVKIYAEPIGKAAISFAILCAILALPYLAWQYRRRGTVAAARTWAQTSFVLYVMSAWALVLLPFPDDPCARTVEPQLEPFNWLQIARAGSSDALSLLTNANTVMFVFNIALLFPLGVYLRRWFGRGFLTTAVLGFAMSLAFEVAQYTALFGYFECTYRQFNVDDLMANTGGAILGWLIAPLVFIVPKRGQEPVAPDRVTVPRRVLSVILDLGITVALTFLVTSIVRTMDLPIPRAPFYVGLLVTCLVLPVLANGRTPGQFSVGIRMQPGRNPLRLAVRWLLVWGVYPLGLVLSGYGISHRDDATGVAALVGTGLLVLWPLALLAGVHEKLSGTATVPEVTGPGTRPPT